MGFFHRQASFSPPRQEIPDFAFPRKGWSYPLEFDCHEQFTAFLQPGHRVGRALDVVDKPGLVDDDRRRALDADGILGQLEPVVDLALRIGEHREGQVKLLRIIMSAFESVAQDDQHLRTFTDKLIVEPAQLGGVRAALQSVELPDKEEDDLLPAII